ncbi:alpha/beta hydrolase (plasmid) [Paraburkholderia sp. PGU19]|uniref:alpha/beta fold hydrolase n=1 Tax=Paraburkholderia sp. PGU19 TaxID=2735434 RepID=UPI0015DBC6F5|nr:alpha/beta hydrolase [Paraburkholderia sp. PGU19]BCG03744.1 alpha/beta hydrolase [Paraburkholderia sp. PGU19]
MAELEKENVKIEVQGVALDLAVMQRAGNHVPILFLHGFGSTKEDYADISRYPAFDGHPVIAYDAPGCGATSCADMSKISVPFLVETAKAVLAHYQIDRFHLVGHSMGGLTALMLADEMPERVLSFVDIEGNVAPEDCFLSRQVIDYPAETSRSFFDSFMERTWHSPFFSCPLYAVSLQHKVRAEAVPYIFRSMVELSDSAGLMDRFLGLPFPRMFMYGEQNASLSYLPTLREHGIQLAEVSHSGHFPMYSNPVEMWRWIAHAVGLAQR